MSALNSPSDFRGLPIAERLALVEEIWDSIIEDEKQFSLSDAHKAELDRRLGKHTADPDRGDSWANVKARILSADQQAVE